MKRFKASYLIHGFALLHVLVTAVCAWTGFPDALLLTALTMTMIVLLCLRYNLTPEFTAVAVILGNVAGFILGHFGAEFFALVIPGNGILQRCAATLVTTELIGWGLLGFVRSYSHPEPDSERRKRSWQKDLGWLIFAVAAVFLVRAFISYVFKMDLFAGRNIAQLFISFLSNAFVLLLIIASIFLILRAGRRRRYSLDAATIWVVLTLLVLSFLCAFLQSTGLPFHWQWPPTRDDLARNVILSILVEITFFAIAYFLDFAIRIREEMMLQREQRHRAEFRYLTLKHQVDPHFLFNSLNILDNIVKEGSREDASTFIHKLAGIYRYLLRHEDDRLVWLSEEVEFAQKYWDLLWIRFPEGFRVVNEIRPEDLHCQVVPCTIQLLLENATKHNVISAENPLVVRLSSDGKNLTVQNNIIPKVRHPESTGMGLKYIRQLYMDLSGNDIAVSTSDGLFTVKLPLL